MRDGQDTRRTSPRTGTGTDTVNTASVKKRLKETASTAVDSIQTVPRKSADAARVAAESVTAKSRKALQSITPLADSLLSTTQALLASRLSGDLNALLANMVKGPATIYDKAMDAAFHANPEGGTFHRLFDGSHTPLGAFKAAKDATPDDTMFQEVRGVLQGLFRDVTTPRGLALVTWNKATYEDVAAFLESNMGIPKSWLYEIVTYDAADLLGGIISVVSTTLCWNRADTETFAKLVGGMGLSAVRGANPLLLFVSVVALARACHKAHHDDDYTAMADGVVKGALNTGATLAAVAQVGALGGPAGLALLAGVSAGVLAHKATEKVSVTQIGQFVAELATAAAAEIRKAGKTHKQISPVSAEIR